jgi:hypothetical protein
VRSARQSVGDTASPTPSQAAVGGLVPVRGTCAHRRLGL